MTLVAGPKRSADKRKAENLNQKRLVIGVAPRDQNSRPHALLCSIQNRSSMTTYNFFLRATYCCSLLHGSGTRTAVPIRQISKAPESRINRTLMASCWDAFGEGAYDLYPLLG